MDYHNFSASQFAADSDFRAWVLRPATDSARFWAEFLVQHPTQTEPVRQARRLVRELAEATESLSPTVTQADEDALWQQLRQRIADETTGGRVVPLRPRWQRTWAVAASVLLLAGFGWSLINQTPTASIRANQSELADAKTGLIDHTNQTNKPETITLSEGSTVVLQPGSQLRYPSQFADSQRTVSLSGDGFFTVVRNPARPFVVYAGRTVTRVLGTSFRVRAVATDPTVSVDVRTGRVSVLALTNVSQRNQHRPGTWAGVLLTPNQRAVFEVATNQLRKDLVAVPVPLPTPAPLPELTFDERPVTDVLARLEAIYGLEIRYDRAILADCTITTTFTTEDLFKRLTLICQAIGATYTVENGQIIIQSTGCTP